MRITLQRVSSACCRVDGAVTGEIGAGLVLLIGFNATDNSSMLSTAATKCLELRIFPDQQGKLNRSLLDTGGSILAISQFTLYANCTRGRRPDFTQAAPPEPARKLYEEFLFILKERGINVQTGVFGADMQLSLVNDGPITINLEW